MVAKQTDHLIQSRPLRYLALGCGIVLSLVSLRFSYSFGESISPEMGIACGAISILSSYMVSIWLGARETLTDIGAPKMIKGLSVVAIGLMSWDGFTNSMTASFQRSKDISTQMYQESAVAAKGNTLSDLKATEKRLIARQAKLDADMDKLVNMKVGEYAVSVRPAAPEVLDGQITAKQLEVDREAARGGCKERCQARTNELAHLKALRALSKEIVDNNTEHSRVISSLANVRNEQADIKVEQSGANFQALKAASWFSLFGGDTSRKPGELTKAWVEDGLGSLAGIMVMLGSQAFCGLGTATKSQVRRLVGRKPDDDDDPQHPVSDLGNRNPESRAYKPLSGIPSEPMHVHTVEHIKDPIIRRWSLSDEVQAMLGGAQLKAA